MEQIRISTRAIHLLIVLLLPLWLGEERSAVAQSDTVIWSRPVNLSNTPPLSAHPAIVADGYGYVHVFWSEEVGGRPREPGDLGGEGNSIIYTRWDGASWTPPVDVLFVPGEYIAEHVAVDVDAENWLHVVWTGQSNFYYSNASSWQAESGHAWSKPMVVATNSARSRWESDVVADAFGNLHIVYAIRGDEAGVYHIRSQDGGSVWESPIKLSEPFDRLEVSLSNVKVITDGDGRLHAVWQTNQEDGYGQAVYYARSVNGGESWSPPVQFEYRDPDDTFVAWPYLEANGESELHLIYTDGSNKGRAYRISTDGGATWSNPYHILAEMEGINGYVIPVMDGSGQMHMVVNMRTRTDQITGIYYTRWMENGWSPVIPVDVSSQSASNAHYTAATVRLGNELYLVWTQLEAGEIWHIHGTIPSTPQIPPLFVPSPQASKPTPPSSATAEMTLQTLTPLPRPTSHPTYSKVPAPASSVTFNPTVLGTAAPLLLVVSVVLWARVRSR